jgi:hypothetical protein
LKKTTAAIAIAALAVPAAAQADKPEDAGSKGREKAQQQQQSKRQNKKSERFRGVGFTVRGLYKGGLESADQDSREKQTIGGIELAATSANKQARNALTFTTRPSKESPQDTTVTDSHDQKAVLRFVGFEEGEKPGENDRVSIIGKVSRKRKGDSSGSSRAIDVRRIVVKDVADPGEQQASEQEKPEQDD